MDVPACRDRAAALATGKPRGIDRGRPIRGTSISDPQSSIEPTPADALRQERLAREAAEREVAALKAEKRQLEYRVINAHRTLAHGLGRAIIDARSLRGMLAFPKRIRRLRLRQKAKRKLHVPDSTPADISARLQLVGEAMAKAASDGPEKAADWLRGDPVGNRPACARALVELAISIAAEKPELALELGSDAARINSREGRLIALALALHDAGIVTGLDRLCAAILAAQPVSVPQHALFTGIIRDAGLLAIDRSATS
jgi:hypothetical protein